MATEVVAGQPYKVFPGGIIVLRASDWLAGARASLTTENDPDSIEGTVVRDTQTVTTSIRTDPSDAFDEALDTLEIDLADIPEIEEGPVGMRYHVFLSVKIEGDWDASNDDTLISANEHQHNGACDAGLYGDVGFTETSPNLIFYKPRGLERYMFTALDNQVRSDSGTNVLRFRFYALDGTSIEWLIDQIVFLPYIGTSGTFGDSWRSLDFEAPGGTWRNVLTPTDGADGGDANGKFTWQPNAQNFHEWADDLVDGLGGGGGDYQKKASAASAEYATHVTPDDGLSVRNTEPSPDEPVLAHCYALCAPRYRPAAVHISDDFTRTVNWPVPTQPGAIQTGEISDEGFVAYGNGADTGGAVTYAAVDGSKAILHMGGQVERTAGVTVLYGQKPAPSAQPGANLRMPQNIQFSGKMRVDNLGASFLGPDTRARTYLEFLNTGSAVPEYGIKIDHAADEWSLVRGPRVEPGGEVALDTPIDISSWFVSESSPSAWLGFRIELKRYLLRARVWEFDAGDEPDTWDVEVFRPIRTSAASSGTWSDYPYGDDVEVAILEMQSRYVGIVTGHGTAEEAAISQWEIHIDDVVVEEDPYGDPDDITVYIEQPDTGSPVWSDEHTLGPSCDRFVYFGMRDFTDENSFDSNEWYLDYAVKAWSATGAAELQRADVPFVYFRGSRLNFTIVSMNWRSSDSQSATTPVFG